MTHTDERSAARLAWTRQILDDASLTLAPASADASFRSYWRTQHQGRSWIVMDSPPAQEDPRPWLEIGAQLAATGLHVPAVHAHDLRQGFLLIEDLGSQLYLPALNEDTADALYGDAMDALLRMQTRMDYSDLPPFDHAVLVRGLEVMPEWFLQRHLGHTPGCDEWDVLEAAFGVIIRNALEQPRCFVHRDFHEAAVFGVRGAAFGYQQGAPKAQLDVAADVVPNGGLVQPLQVSTETRHDDVTDAAPVACRPLFRVRAGILH